jgi:hypothetical protein
MKSITIHGVDKPLTELIKSKATSEGLSVNRTIKKMLESALGVRPMQNHTNRREFEEFCGVWSKADLSEFEKNTAPIRKVDPGDWQ